MTSKAPYKDEVLFSAARPVILNGINDVVERPDLADRAIVLTLGHLSESRRRSEKALWQEFEIARPQILGALMDATVRGLRNQCGVRLERLPRMSDFALWAAACEPGTWPIGSFEQAYWRNRRTAVEDVVDRDSVAASIRDFAAERQTWTGSASDLIAAVNNYRKTMGDSPALNAEFPRNPRVLAGRLRRAQTFLRTLGIEITFNREGRFGNRIIRISSSAPARSSHMQVADSVSTEF